MDTFKLQMNTAAYILCITSEWFQTQHTSFKTNPNILLVLKLMRKSIYQMYHAISLLDSPSLFFTFLHGVLIIKRKRCVGWHK